MTPTSKAQEPPPRVLVTLHYPLDMALMAAVLEAVARVYPGAVLGEDGTVWDRSPAEAHEFLAASAVDKP